MWRHISKNLEPFQYTVWTEFTPLAIKNKAINLGQGFPGFPCPDFVKQSLADATNSNENQYSKPQGVPALVEEIARHYGKKHNRSINPMTEVAVTEGATEGLLSAFLSMVDKGDEVVIIDPSFDLYVPQTILAGGIPRLVSLIPPEEGQIKWGVDFEKLEQAFNEKTRVFVINTPHNPLGKMFSREELERIAQILEKWPNVAIISDEVYEHIAFNANQHLSLCDFSNLWERTATFSSAGKIFSVTGWKIGWAVGGPEIMRKITTSHLWTTFCSNTTCQGAIARSLRIADNPYMGFPNYYQWIAHQYSRKKEILYEILSKTEKFKIEPMEPDGGFFLLGRVNPNDIDPKYLANGSPDFAFCRWMTENLKICAIPCSAFFSPQSKHLGDKFVRFALCKDYSEYEAVAKILN